MTPRRRILLQKLTFTQLVKKFPSFHGNWSLPLVPILREMHPVHTIPPYFPKIHFNIIFPSMLGLLSCWLSVTAEIWQFIPLQIFNSKFNLRLTRHMYQWTFMANYVCHYTWKICHYELFCILPDNGGLCEWIALGMLMMTLSVSGNGSFLFPHLLYPNTICSNGCLPGGFENWHTGSPPRVTCGHTSCLQDLRFS